jgi:hypothetical protein
MLQEETGSNDNVVVQRAEIYNNKLTEYEDIIYDGTAEERFEEQFKMTDKEVEDCLLVEE